jgi:methylglutaconyl-CoA hydratase
MPDVLYELKDHVAHIRLNRPAQRNAMSEALVVELTEVLKRADSDSGVRAILLGAEGKHFCAGGDFKDFIGHFGKSLDELYETIAPSMELFKLGFELRTPLVAAVKGAAMGGGVGLVAMSHIAIAADSAKFGLPEVTLGLFPFAIFPLVSRSVGLKKALELSLTSRTLTASDALGIGLVQRVVPEGRIEEEALETAQGLTTKSPLAVRTGLEIYNRMSRPDDSLFEHAGLLRLLTFKSEALKGAIEQFLAQRGQGG